MTNIFMRNKKDTPFKVSMKAIELSAEIIKVLNREKNIPKHHRYITIQPIINKTYELLENIIAANEIYATDDLKLEMKLRYYERAKINIAQLQDFLLVLEKSITELKAAKLANIGRLMSEVSALLTNWKKTFKKALREVEVDIEDKDLV